MTITAKSGFIQAKNGSICNSCCQPTCYNLRDHFYLDTDVPAQCNTCCYNLQHHAGPLVLGPWTVDVELYAGSILTIDDDIAFDGVIFQEGQYVSLAACNNTHTIASGTILAVVPAGSQVSITVIDHHGLVTSAAGNLCLRNAEAP